MKRYYTATEELTTSEIIEKYGDILTEEQINELKNLDQRNKKISEIDIEKSLIELEVLKEYLKNNE